MGNQLPAFLESVQRKRCLDKIAFFVYELFKTCTPEFLIMFQIVADSSSLILLAKCSLITDFCDRFEVIVPSSVIAEVASDELIRRYPDASLISELVSKGAIRVRRPEHGEFALPLTLHRGEQDALRIASNLADCLLATDDGKAIKAARFLKIPFVITPKIVIELYKSERITFQKARDAMEKLSKIGRYSPEIIADALLKLVEENNAKTNNRQNT
jgi:predicted nucleic acid-binding protein